MTTNTKIAWYFGGVVIIVLLTAYLVHAHKVQEAQQAAALNNPPSGLSTASTTASSTLSRGLLASTSSTTKSGSGTVKSSTPPQPSTSSDGTVTFEAPNTVTIPTGKSAVETISGFRLTLQSIDGDVATIRVYTGSCANGYCTSREDAGQNVQFSTGESLSIDGFVVKILSISTNSATFTVTAAVGI